MKSSNNKENTQNQIFYDKSKVRWPIFLITVGLGITLIIFIYYGLVKSIQQNVILPQVTIPNTNTITKVETPTTNVNNAQTTALKKIATLFLGIAKKVSATPNSLNVAFYQPSEPDGWVSLKRNLATINVLIPEWIYLKDETGAIGLYDTEDQSRVLTYLQNNNSDVKVEPLINNYSDTMQDFDPVLLGKVLRNPTARKNLVENLYTYATTYKLSGITIDLENTNPLDEPYYNLFTQQLHARFTPDNLQVLVGLPPDNVDVNYSFLSKNSDYLIFMMYDNHWNTGPAGAIAPQDWFINSLTNISKMVPKEKTLIALGNYAYDWDLTKKTPAVTRTVEETLKMAKDSGAQVQFDQTTLNPKFSYVDTNKDQHSVWYLDATTFYNQFLATQKFNMAGIGIWRLGSEDSSIWSIFKNRDNLSQAIPDISNINLDLSIMYQGTGEVLKVISAQHPGKRDITTDKVSGLITNQNITVYPDPFEIQRLGSGVTPQKQIALTFDDGPSNKYTPEILKILKDNNVTATFFIVGSQANLYPDIIKQMYQAGNEIGSHTYTHPNLSKISTNYEEIELNSTQRLIESITGHSTLLFRPPFGEDAEPETPEEINPVLLTSELGYYTVGMGIDPKDWAQPGSDEIVNRISAQLQESDGHIILLHDSGGDREQTIQALSKIISTLKDQGYTFVSVSDLMGLPKDIVMPPIQNQSALNTFSNDAGFIILSKLLNLFKILFWIGIILGIARIGIIISLATFQKLFSRFKKFDDTYQPKVSVIVPAWNEEKVIIQTVETLLKSDYKNFDILVVENGSSDKTYRVAQKEFRNNPKVKVYSLPNGGKSNALNYAATISSAEILIIQDADGIILPDTISKIVKHFANPKVGAVSGNVKVGNKINIITKLQALEYVISQNLDRRAFSVLNAIAVVPGAIGGWRKDVVNKLDGFYSDTLAEDTELTLRIAKLSYKIAYEQSAIAYTEAPETIDVFIKQRFRWMFGTFQAAWKHLNTLFNPKYRAMGFVTIPNIIIYQVLFPIVAPLLDIFTIAALAFALWQRNIHTDISSDSLYQIIGFYLLFTLVDFITCIVAFLLEPQEDKKLLIYLPLQRLFYRYLLYVVSIKSMLTVVKGPYVEWELKERKGNLFATETA